MMGKRGSGYLVIVFLFAIIFSQVAYADWAAVQACNDAGGIWCNGDENSGTCKGQSVPSITQKDYDCTVLISQNVTLDSDYKFKFSESNLKLYEFNSIKVSGGVKVQFYLSKYPALSSLNPYYPKAADGTCAHATSAGSDDRKAYPYAGPDDADWNAGRYWNSYTSTTGGDGGRGGMEKSAFHQIWGGGGGAGAGGGLLGIAGGNGASYSGGTGANRGTKECGGTSDASGNTGYGGLGGRAGGFVHIKASSITIEGELSVSGESGTPGKTGSSGSGAFGGGNGGGPGGGGGGAGKIVLTYSKFESSGTISANGGNGGKGGAGSNGGNCANGANAGGGGGGNGGIIGLSANPGSTGTTNPKLQCSGGIGGEAGELGPNDECGGGSDESKITAKKGNDGIKGQCGASETNPANVLTIATPRANCNDGNDNDGDGVIDMDDTDCVNYNEWDATIWDDFTPRPASYAKSATDVKDLACGDDAGEGKCNFVVATQGTCENKPGVCDTRYCPQPVGYDDYPCGCENEEVCETVPSGIISVELGSGTPMQISTFTCKESVDCASLSTLSACLANSKACTWTGDVPTVTCSNMLTESDCKAQEYNGCRWSFAESTPGVGDLGYLTEDKKYLCLDSWDKTGAGAGVISTFGNDYAWFNAEGTANSVPNAFPDYSIFQAGNTQFITNGAEWFQCDASAASPNYAATENLIPEYRTFNARLSAGTYYCHETLEAAFSTEENPANIFICEAGKDAAYCTEQCSKTDDCIGWCRNTVYPKGKLQDTCGGQNICRMNPQNEKTTIWPSLTSFMSTPANKAIICAYQPFESNCEPIPPYQKMGNQEKMPQDYCKINPELCVGGIIPTNSKCSDIYEDTHLEYPGNAEALCSRTEACVNGNLIQTGGDNEGVTDVNDMKFCCYGQEAHCSTLEPAQCSERGGELKPPTCITCECTSDIQVGDCCMYGRWIDQSASTGAINESFRCFKQGDKSLIQECCGETRCFNSDNPLNDKPSLNQDIYSMDGVPLHSFANYDTADENGRTERLVRTFLGNYEPKETIPVGGDFYESSVPINWQDFDFLEFDMLYNAELPFSLILTDISGKQCSFSINNNIAVRKGAERWQHITIPLKGSAVLTDCVAAGFNPQQVSSEDTVIYVGEGGIVGGVNVALDNFFLRSLTDASNSKNMFCSGNWGDWVENLDGPSLTSENVFVGTTPELSKFGPFRDACEGVISYGWTGHVCCGDDTRANAFGEYWIDDEGACWNGTTIYNDQTVAESVGIIAGTPKYDSSIKEKSLLYFNHKMISCNMESSIYASYKKSYAGEVGEGSFGEGIINVVPYTVRGSWICEKGKGWVNVEDVPRVRLLAANLQQIAVTQSADEYTLACGDYTKLANTFGTENDDEIPATENICVLRMGNNKLDSDEKLAVGIEIERGVDINDYIDNHLEDEFPVLNIDTASDSTTCDDLSKTQSDADKFFTRCAVDEISGLSIYYNAPLNMVIIADGTIRSSNVDTSGTVSMLSGMWDSFVSFFSKLFGEHDEQGLSCFEEVVTTKDFYLSVQDNKAIKGAIDKSGEYSYYRIDYINMVTDVSILEEALKSNFPQAQLVEYSQSFVDPADSTKGNTQTIFVMAKTLNNVDWRTLTQILRLDAEPETKGTLETTLNLCPAPAAAPAAPESAGTTTLSSASGTTESGASSEATQPSGTGTQAESGTTQGTQGATEASNPAQAGDTSSQENLGGATNSATSSETTGGCIATATSCEAIPEQTACPTETCQDSGYTYSCGCSESASPFCEQVSRGILKIPGSGELIPRLGCMAPEEIQCSTLTQEQCSVYDGLCHWIKPAVDCESVITQETCNSRAGCKWASAAEYAASKQTCNYVPVSSGSCGPGDASACATEFCLDGGAKYPCGCTQTASLYCTTVPRGVYKLIDADYVSKEVCSLPNCLSFSQTECQNLAEVCKWTPTPQEVDCSTLTSATECNALASKGCVWSGNVQTTNTQTTQTPAKEILSPLPDESATDTSDVVPSTSGGSTPVKSVEEDRRTEPVMVETVMRGVNIEPKVETVGAVGMAMLTGAYSWTLNDFRETIKAYASSQQA